MKALWQLVREFYVPLTIGVAWTAYNLVGMPQDKWTVTNFVNLFAPTFFFASWLIAQWYRVRKQQRVEDSLAAIQAGLAGAAFPLLPFKLQLVSRYAASAEMYKKVFANRPQYKVLDMPLLQISGLGSRVPPSCWKEQSARKYRSFVPSEELPPLYHATQESEVRPFKVPVRVEVQFFAPHASNPSFAFHALDPLSEHCVAKLDLFDDVIYQTTRYDSWRITNSSTKPWNVLDLRGMRLHLELKYVLFHPADRMSPPTIHDLHFYFGPEETASLYLTSNQLAAQIFVEDDEDRKLNALNDHMKMTTMVLDVELSDEIHSDQLVQATGGAGAGSF